MAAPQLAADDNLLNGINAGFAELDAKITDFDGAAIQAGTVANTALALGKDLDCKVVQHGVPPLPTLSLTVRIPGQELFGVAPTALDELHWALLLQLASATGLRLERQVDAHQVTLRLGFLPA